MKAYRTNDQLKLVGKAWEIRTYLEKQVKTYSHGKITVNEWLAFTSGASPRIGKPASASASGIRRETTRW